jgi:hypothetical protein
MRVFLLRMVAAKNSRKWQAALAPATAITRGTRMPSRGDRNRFGLRNDDLSIHAERLQTCPARTDGKNPSDL